MLRESELEMVGDQIAALYQALEQDVIADIARRVKKTKRFTETAELMAQAMKETGKSPDQIRAEVMKLIRADKAFQDEIAKNTKEWKEFVREEIKATEAAAKEAGNDIIANAGDMSFNYDMEAWQQAGVTLTKDSAFTRMVEEMSKATAGTLKNLTRSTGFKGVHGTTALKNAYRQYLDKALIKMATGTFSYDQCVNDCVKELAQSGLRSVDYASGRTYQLDTAARMAIRTANSQLAGQISMHYIEETDTDLVEVSAHWGARPEHAAWQGKIYSRSGKNKKYPNFSVCHYGAVDGLKGINCRHDFYPFFEGVSEPNTWEPEPEPQEYRGKTYNYYQATQKQRKMERDIRSTKREIEAQKAIGGDTSLLEAQKRKQIKEYHNFSNAMGIRAKDNRLRVIKGTSDLKTAKKSVEKGNRSDIIKSDLGKFKQKLQNDSEIKGEYYTCLKDKFSHGRDDAKRAFVKYASGACIENGSYEGVAHFNTVTKKISMHYGADLENPRGAGVTYFHEHGHLIDDATKHLSDDKEFKRLLENDSLKYRLKYGKEHHLNTFDKVDKAIGGELNDMRKHSAVSDMFEGVTHGNIRGCAGHPEGYWDNESNITLESFAHMFEAQFDKERYAEMKKYFPQSLEYFEKKLKGVL